MRNQLGQTVMTKNVGINMEANSKFRQEVVTALDRYIKKDWGDCSEEDKVSNNYAYINGGDRILAVYNTSKGKLYIITEWDRSYTTILFANEY